MQLQNQIKTRKINDIKLQLNIAQNPHTKDPKQIFKALDQLEENPVKRAIKLDETGINTLKSVLANNSRVVVK